MKAACQVIEGPQGLLIYHRGPDKQEGPLPSLFYFALGGEESLMLDPFKQPIEFLQNQPLRTFSLSLPGHGKGCDPHCAMSQWALQLEQGQDIIGEFVAQFGVALEFLIEQRYVNIQHVALAGLSRGAFVAAHLAAHDPRLKIVLGYAPLTNLERLNEFAASPCPLIESLSIKNLVDKLCHKTLRFYIGNLDTRVGTADCFALIQALAENAHAHRHRSPPIELIIYPSVGHKGHGTPPHIFQSGSAWLLEHLCP